MKLPESLLLEYTCLFSCKPRPVNDEPQLIDLADNIPVVSAPYPIAYVMREPCCKRIQSWLESGVIQEQSSPYVSLVHCVWKAGKT